MCKKQEKVINRISNGYSNISVFCEHSVMKIILQYLEGYVYYLQDDNGKNYDMKITLLDSLDNNELPEFHDLITLHCEKKGYYYNKGKSSYLFSIKDNILYEIKKGEICVYGKTNEEYFLECVRLIRICFQISLMRNGYRKLHMSVVVNKTMTYGLIGDKGAGKTTMLLHFLKNGCSLISNDKVVISKEGNCFGVCQRIGILEYTMSKFALPKDKTEKIGDKYYFWPAELVQHYNVSINNNNKIDIILVLKYDANSDILIREITDVGEKKKMYEKFVKKYSDKSEMNEIMNIILDVNQWIVIDEEKEIYDEIHNKMWIEIKGEFEKLRLDMRW